MKLPLVYAVHSANLFGTERMALATLEGLRDTYDPILLCPQGLLVEEALHRRISVFVCSGTGSLLRVLMGLLMKYPSFVFLSTGIKHAFCLAALNFLPRRRIAHLHLVHGGAAEQLSYGRKKWLNRQNLLQVAVSSFVAEKLVQYGVKADKIRVAGNFLTEQTRVSIRRRQPFSAPTRTKGLVISRLITGKRVDLLFDALEAHDDLGDVSFVVYGLGGQHEILRNRAVASKLRVELPGFSGDLSSIIADYDFLVHLCSEEPFGLVILEAMAAGLPVLVPDRGGVTTIVNDGENGFLFESDNPTSLADGIRKLRDLPPKRLNEVTARAQTDLDTRFSSAHQLERYRELIEEAS